MHANKVNWSGPLYTQSAYVQLMTHNHVFFLFVCFVVKGSAHFEELTLFNIFAKATSSLLVSYRLNSKRGFGVEGTLRSGHDRKWNCVTVLVSLVCEEETLGK